MSDQHVVREAQQQYHQALGVFVEMFAKAEEMTRIALWTIAGVDAPTSRALWERIQVNRAIAAIRKLHAERRESLSPALGEALDQLSDIAQVRNMILHQGTYLDTGGNLITSTWRYYDPPDNVKQFNVSAPFLNVLSQDLQLVIARLSTHFAAPKDPAHAAKYAEMKEIVPQAFAYQSPVNRAPSKARKARVKAAA